MLHSVYSNNKHLSLFYWGRSSTTSHIHHIFGDLARHAVHILQMSAQIAALGEGLLTVEALEGPQPSVLPEVIPQVAAFFEHAPTTRVFAFKV
jgi:hypothetical protein